MPTVSGANNSNHPTHSPSHTNSDQGGAADFMDSSNKLDSSV